MDNSMDHHRFTSNEEKIKVLKFLDIHLKVSIYDYDFE